MKTSHFLFSILLASIFTISCSSSKKATSATEKGTEVKELETTPKESTTKIDDREDKLKKTIASYPDSLVVLLKRTPCYGKCPIYILKIYASGYATYEGKNFVEMEGNYAGKMGKESIAALLKKVDEINFFELKNIYDSNVSDLPSAHIYINKGGNKKQIINRHGGPKELKELASIIDEHVKKTEWKKV